MPTPYSEMESLPEQYRKKDLSIRGGRLSGIINPIKKGGRRLKIFGGSPGIQRNEHCVLKGKRSSDFKRGTRGTTQGAFSFANGKDKKRNRQVRLEGKERTNRKIFREGRVPTLFTGGGKRVCRETTLGNLLRTLLWK